MSTADEETRNGNRDHAAIERRINRAIGDAVEGWRTCSVRACRRNRRCSSDSFACMEKRQRENTRVLTPEEQAQSMHELRLMLDARRAELDKAAARDEKADKAMPWRKRGGGW